MRTLLTLCASCALLLGVCSVAAAAGQAGWTVRGVAQPSVFSANEPGICESEAKCDHYQLLVTNVGDESSSETITLTDTLPPGIETLRTPESGHTSEGAEWNCTGGAGNTSVTCKFEGSVPAGGYAPFLDIEVSTSNVGTAGSLRNEASVTGGGTSALARTSEETSVGAGTPPFSVSSFGLEATDAGGAPALEAGSHPWEITTSFEIPALFSPPSPAGDGGTVFRPVENVKNVLVELPPGLVGDPQAIPRCTEVELREEECPADSRVGAFGIIGDKFQYGEFRTTGAEGLYPPEGGCCSAIYNVVPQGGYPAEFGFTFANVPVFLYASVVHTGSGYHLRVASAGIPSALETAYAAITFFGDPGKLNEEPGETAFLTNPADCSKGGPSSISSIGLDSWENPQRWVAAESETYPQLTGCNLLQFDPSVELTPSPPSEGGTTQADEPSGENFDLKVPQTSGFSERATPELKDATVTLPEGVSVSPSAAEGLVGCSETGPQGINVGSDQIGPEGQDLGDPEATELGEGHAGPGGNASPYDDGLYHTAPGHCPAASTLGTVEVCTPLLPNRANGDGVKEEGEKACEEHSGIAPLQGHVYLAQPKCGGAGQPACTEASATNGELFGLYIEMEGSGVIVKLPGTVSANPQTGQLTASFKENPQLPFSDLRLHFHGGPRAPLANPQSCGSFATTSMLTSWASETPVSGSSSFEIGGCSGNPFNPAFSAGTTTPVAGAYSPFTLSFARNDGEQDLSGITLSTPPGLLGVIAGVTRCGEVEANAGTCPSASQIGTTTVTAGAGSEPYTITGGRVYLTGPYNGRPFGLSIVVPAVAGPFNLGNVIVRASIAVNPATAQLTIVSNPLPQVVDGVPVRLRTVNVEVNRPSFMLNATNCNQQSIAATITGEHPLGSGEAAKTSAVSVPYGASGCAGLPFKPKLTASAGGKGTKAGGSSFDVKLESAGLGQANIAKVDLQLPKALSTRDSTLNKACTEAQFAANPAGCPEGSIIGNATIHTPILSGALTGPVYLVSHGGAAFPDVEIVLQGEGVTLVLDGKTDIKKGITYSNFESTPDAPFTSFETELPTGPHSIFTANVPAKANYSLCGTNLSMPTRIVGQNGAVIEQSTKIPVAGCDKPQVKINKVKVKNNRVLVTVTTTQPGTLTIRARGLKTVAKSLSAGLHQLHLAFTKTDKAARKHRIKTKVQVTVKNSIGSATKVTALKYERK
jgi:hypothetical protein